MRGQLDAKKYREAWQKAARKSTISGFQTSGWGSKEVAVTESKEFRKSDFIDALKKAARRKEQLEPSSK